MPFVKNPEPFKRYCLTFYLSGMDIDGNPITDHQSLYHNITAQTQERAEAKLRKMFYDCVEVNITSCEEVQAQ